MDEIKGLTPTQLKDKFSLTYEPTHATPASINSGANIRLGSAAGVKNLGTKGGGFQIEVLSDNKTSIQFGETTKLK